jgi:WD repeat-containing protein 89
MWSTVTSPNRTVVTSFSPRRRSFSTVAESSSTSPFEDGDWVVRLTASAAGSQRSTIACALSSGEIQIYDQETLHRVFSLPPPNATDDAAPFVEDMSYDTTGQMLVCARRGGMVQAYDLRGGGEWSCATLNKEAALSVAVGYENASVVAVGTSKSRIHFFDGRRRDGIHSSSSSCLLGTYSDAHTDDVTCLKFHSAVPSLLLSGSEDGLACIFDTTQPTESMALKSVMNVGSPLRQVGFCAWSTGANGGMNTSSSSLPSTTVYCRTGSETVSIWHGETGICLHDFEGWTLRQRLSESIGQKMDYLIDVHWLSSTHELLLTAGNTSNHAGVLYKCTGHTWAPCGMIRGGHQGVIRASLPLSSATLLTAGEDARLCEWKMTSMSRPEAPLWKRKIVSPIASPVMAATSGPIRRQRFKSSSTAETAPY